MPLLVSIQQAAMNALCAWLEASLLGSPSVEPRWPDPDKILTGGGTAGGRYNGPVALTIIPRGKPRDEYLDSQVSSTVDNGDGTLKVRRVQAFRAQPLQLDVWAAYDVERDDLIAQLDALFAGAGGATTDPIVAARRSPEEHGVALTLGDGWGTPPADPVVADFDFEGGPEVDDTADQIGRVTYRATYFGEARMMLSVTTTDPKLARVTLKQMLAIANVVPPPPAIPVPPAPPAHLEIDAQQDVTGKITFTDGG